MGPVCKKNAFENKETKAADIYGLDFMRCVACDQWASIRKKSGVIRGYKYGKRISKKKKERIMTI